MAALNPLSIVTDPSKNGIFCFNSVPESDWEKIGVCRSRKKREALFHQGDPAKQLFCIREGAVGLERLMDDGRRQLVELLLPGDVCGLSCNGYHNTTAVVLVDSKIYVFDAHDFEKFPQLSINLVQQFQKQLCNLHEHMLAIGRMAALERVCVVLMRIAMHEYNHDYSAGPFDDGIPIHIPLTRGEMGDFLGLSLETICRVMTELERRGIIEIGRRHGDVLIKDIEALQALVG